ncbi:MAG: hypothetical protein ACFFG0_00215 [Candidatus Thorarchaeota archaeon]
MNIEYYYLLITSATIISILLLGFKFFRHFKRTSYIKNFTEYAVVFKYYLEKAYELVHKDNIFSYSLEGLRVEEDKIDEVSEQFARLFIKLIGPALYKEFINFYGDDDTFMFNVLEYFNSRYEDDEIRKQTLEELASKEEEG